ncbi:MAG: hypothetical protein ACREF4_17135 [Gammaproteobacteria bacterium]
MSTESGEQVELESAIASVYAGPPEGFVGRRDALAKQLRAAGRREDANTVKGLRKPARMAWALNAAVHGGRGTIDRLGAAVAAILAAQSGSGDLRGAMGELRGAARGFADDAARAASEGGHPVDAASLVNAVLAVIGEADAFEALRAGRLADIPEAGGLDFLTNLPSRSAVASAGTAEPVAKPGKPDTTLREALKRADDGVAAARERALAARRALGEAESNAESAERQLREVERQVRERRAQLDRVRQEANAAAEQLADAEKIAADARARLRNDD